LQLNSIKQKRLSSRPEGGANALVPRIQQKLCWNVLLCSLA
jgi:hypothetical protein